MLHESLYHCELGVTRAIQERAKSIPVHLGGIPTAYKDGLRLRQIKRNTRKQIHGRISNETNEIRQLNIHRGQRRFAVLNATFLDFNRKLCYNKQYRSEKLQKEIL